MREAQGYAVPHIDDIVSDASAEQAAKEEYGKSRGQQLDLQKKSFGLDQRRFDISKELTAKREAASKAIADRGFALDREMMSIQDEQNKWANGIEIANIGVESMGAVYKVRQAEKEAQQLQKMTSTYIEILEKLKARGI